MRWRRSASFADSAREKEKLNHEWSTAIRLAQRNGASLREIAAAAGVAHQTVSKIARE
jgi:DNA-binding XRE family transcriptional regulator